MARYGFSKRARRALALTSAFVTASGAWTSAGGGAHRDPPPSAAVIVRLTDLGLERPTDDSIQVILYATGPARVGVGDAEPTPLTDTLRLSSLPAITADVTEADVHIRLLSPGRMRLGGEVSGGRVMRFTATGRHIVVLKGGMGADTITDP
jgi:hypothetical protein